jgi:hypothetical protein
MSRRSRITSLLAWLVASLLASTALAAPTLPGVNIRWDDCYADGGVTNKSFACDTNTGADVAVLSLQLDSGMPVVSGMEIRISFKAAAPTLPAWWQFMKAGSCRASALSFLLSPALPPGNCLDWGHGVQQGGLAAYRVDELGPASAVLLIASAVAPKDLVQLDPATEYVVGGLRVCHLATVGAGSCGGCDVPVCILFTSLDVTTPVLANDRLFTQGANGVDSQVVHWQNGQVTSLVNTCTGTFNCNTQFDCALAAAAPTAARRSTWGAVKALYR